MNVKGKYLKDESGNIFSPVVSADTSYWGTTKLSTQLSSFKSTLGTHNTSIDGLKGTTLFSGSSYASNVKLSQSLFNFTYFRMIMKTGKSTDTPKYSPYFSTGLLPVINDGQYTASFPTAIWEENWRQYVYNCIYKISSSNNTTITYLGGFFECVYINDNNKSVNFGWAQNDTSNLQVIKVIGYKI